MCKFQPGQRVICIKSHKTDEGLELVKEGETYVVKNVKDISCACTRKYGVDIGVRLNQARHYCTSCNKNAFFDDICWIWEGCFVPIEEETTSNTELNKMVEVSFSKVKEYAPIGAN
jgi:hypothetical protein